MSKTKDQQNKLRILRAKAEEQLNSAITNLEDTPANQKADITSLVHELQVHEIELEMQNDELLHAQGQIEESRQKYFDLFNFAPVCYFTFDKQGIILDLNLTAATFFGVDKASVIGENFNMFIHREHKDAFYKHLRKLSKDITNAACELIISSKNGAEKYVQLISVPIENENLPAQHCRTTLFDITDRKQTEKLQQELKSIVDSSSDMIALLDKDCKYISVNKAYCQGTKVVEEDIIGNTPAEVVGREYFQNTIKPNAEACLKGNKVHYQDWIELPGSSPRYLDVMYTPHQGLDNTISGFVINARDITDQETNHQQNLEQARFLDKIIESSALSTWISDSEGTAVHANPACLAFFGASEDEVIGKYNIFQDNVMKESGVIPEIRNVFEKGVVANIVTRYDLKDVEHNQAGQGSEKIVDSIFTPVCDQNGVVTNVIVQSIDLTEIKRAEQIAIEERNRANEYLEVAEVMMLSLDVDGNIAMVNPKGCEILGYDHDELIGMNWFDNFITEEIRNEIKQVSAKVYAGEIENVKHFENEVLTKNGKKLVAWHNSIIKDQNNKITHTLSSGVDITESRMAELALAESESRLRGLIENLDAGVVVHAPDTAIVLYNDKARQLLDLEQKEIMGLTASDPVWQFIDENHAVLSGEAFPVNQIIRTKKPLDGMLMGIKRPDKTDPIWVLVSGAPILDASGELVEIIISFFDVTERQLAEARLRESEKRLRNAVANSPIPIIIYDENDKILQLSKGWTKYSGYTIDDIPTMSDWTEKAYGKKTGLEKEYIDNLFKIDKTEKNGERTIKTKDGSKRIWDFQTTPLGSVRGKYRVLQSLAIDVTEQRETEGKMRYHATLLKNISDAVISFDTNYTVISWNDAAEKIFGHRSEEVLGQKYYNILSVTHENTDKDEIMVWILDQGKWQGEGRVKHKNGNIMDTSMSSILIKDTAGNPVSVVTILRDITEQKKEETRRSDYSQWLEEMVEKRTLDLKEKIIELERFHAATIDRELRMKELRDEIEELKKSKRDR